MSYQSAECLIFTIDHKEESCTTARSGNCPQVTTDCVRGYVLLPAAFLDQHSEYPRLFDQNNLRVVRNEDLPRLPAPDHRLSAYEIFLDESPSASVDPVSVSTDQPDANFITLLICNATVKITRYTLKASEIRPAVDETNVNAFKYLVARNFELAEGGSGGILHLATSRRQEVLLRTVLDNGADVNSKTDRGSTALHLAVVEGSIPLVKVLLDRGAVVDTKDWTDRTPLHDACRKDLNLAQLLVERGADVNANTAAPWTRGTPLHEAAAAGKPEIVLMLLKKGAVVDAKNNRGETSLHLTQKLEVQEILLQYGADTNIYDKDFYSPIMRAIQYGRADSIEILLNYGARVDLLHIRCTAHKCIIDFPTTGMHTLDNIKMLLEYSFVDPKLVFRQVDSYPWNEYHMEKSEFDKHQLILEHALKIKALHNYSTTRGSSYWKVWKNKTGVPNTIHNYHDNTVSIGKFKESCDAEVASLKNQKFSGTDVSMRDVLAKDEYRVYRLLMNPAFSVAIDPDVLKRQFPIYGGILNLHFRKGKHRRWLQLEGIISFKLLSRGFRRLPDEIIEEIVSLLGTVEILNLRLAIAARAV